MTTARKDPESMSSCLTGREVVIRLRHRRTGATKSCSVVCPAIWTKSRLLSYVRREHPDETVVIENWKSPWFIGTDGAWGATRLWIVDPAEMLAGRPVRDHPTPHSGRPATRRRT